MYYIFNYLFIFGIFKDRNVCFIYVKSFLLFEVNFDLFYC